MTNGEHGEAVMQAVNASLALYERAAGREYTRDEKRLLQRYQRTIDEHSAQCGVPATKGLLPTTKES